MILKEIKPGMVIHCKTKEEIKVINDLGYKLISGQKIDSFIEQECYVIVRNEYIVDWTRDYDTAIDFGTIVEFSDLILPELTPEETLRVFGELCAGVGCSRCPFDSIKGDSDCPTFLLEHYKEAAEICAMWKSDHDKKEPEIETVDICRIIEIQPDGRKRCVHEENIKPDPDLPYGYEIDSVHEILKRFFMEHDGEFIAVHEVVSRVKK